MPGPAPTPIPLRVLRGNLKRAFRRGLEPERPAEPPEPPPFLVGYACDEWYRVAGGLHQLGLLTALDVGPLAVCYPWCGWRQLTGPANASIQNNSGLSQGLANPSAAG